MSPYGRAKEHGQALVEFALAVPFLLILVFGIIDFGSALHAKIAITKAAREGARLAARGNIFTPEQVLQVVRDQSRSVDLATQATVLLTTVRTDCCGLFSYSTASLSGGAGSRLDAPTLQALHQSLTASEPDYLRREEFVVLEILYNHEMLAGLWGLTLPMYTYTVMPVSAPS